MDPFKKLFLLDAYALIFRAYYAFIKNPRYNSKGLNTSAILGFVNTLHEVLSKEKPSHIAVVFDPPSPTFRKERFPEYKANRDATPEDILLSVPYIKKVLEAFGIQMFEVEGFEADDTIGTIAQKAENEGFVTYMMTPDKDYAQLVSKNTFMYKPKRSGNQAEVWGVKEVCERFGVETPLQVIDILALWGDAADNVPGVPGVGEKTAIKLIGAYKSVEGLYENTSKLKGKQKEKVESNREQAFLSKELVTIVTDVPVELNFEELKVKDPDYEALKTLFDELEFKSLAERIIPGAGVVRQGSLFGEDDPSLSSSDKRFTKFKTIDTAEHNYLLLESEEEVDRLVKKLEKTTEFCFDTETNSIDAHSAELVGIAFSYRKFEAFYIPLNVAGDWKKIVLEKVRGVLENPSIKKVGQNLKYDIPVLANAGVFVQGEIFDTMLAHYLLAPEKRHNLNLLAEVYLNYSPVSIENLIGKKGKGQISMENVPLEEVKEYAGEDVDITLQLKEVLAKELAKDPELERLAREVEFPLVYVLAKMERNGVKISVDYLKKYEKELVEKMQNVELAIYDAAGTPFNIASPKQLGVILFERLKITDKPKRTKTKQYATNETELLKLKDLHEIVPLILEYRGYAKLLSTYVKALPELIHPLTGKIHTSFNQAVTITGRLSSTNPNLQNIPIKTEDGRRMREAFVPENEDHLLYAADYSQIELRLMAHLSGDEQMIASFNEGEDIHTATAAKIFKVDTDMVSKEMRSRAKSANFGIIYGISAFGLSSNLGISRSEAKDLIEGYFKSYPGVKQYMEDCIVRARETGVVRTLLGRKRSLLYIDSRNSLHRSNDERNAINAPIQGTAADIIKLAMIRCDRRMVKEGLKSKLILQVHDELVFDVPKEERGILEKIITEEMENAVSLSVSLPVEGNFGNNWLEAH